MGHGCMLENFRTGPAGRKSECRGNKARICMSVRGTERGSHHIAPNPGKPLPELIVADQFEAEPHPCNACRVAFEGCHFGLCSGPLEMAGAHELAIDADEFLQARPYGVSALGQSNLLRRAPLTPHAAIINAARLGAAEALVKKNDGKSHATKSERCGTADKSAADDCHVLVYN